MKNPGVVIPEAMKAIQALIAATRQRRRVALVEDDSHIARVTSSSSIVRR